MRAAVVPAEAASAAPAAAPTTVPANDAVPLFVVGSPALSPEASKELEPLIAALEANPVTKLTVSGYHSTSGSLARNQKLAEQRASAVRDAVKERCARSRGACL